MIEVKELYEQFCLRVPVKQYEADPADFRGVLKRELEEYMFLLDWMRKENILSDENVEEVGRTCKKINEIATSIF